MDERIRHFLSPSLRYFAAVARYGSFRGAARELNIASSAVNRQIIALEESLGVELFERIGRRIRLSAAGEMLQRHLASAIVDFEGVTTELDAMRGLKTGRVRVATVESVAAEFLPDVLMRFSAAHPGIELVVSVAVSDDVERLVLAGEADVGLTFNPRERGAFAIGFSRNLAIGAVTSPGHPLAQLRQVGIADCMRFALALPARGLSLRQALDSTAALRTGDYRMRLEANALGLMRDAAASGQVVAFHTRVGLSRDLAAGRLVFHPLTDADLPVDQFAVIRRAGKDLDLAPATFHGFVVQELARAFDATDADSAAERP